MLDRTRLGLAHSFGDQGAHPRDELDRESDIAPLMIETRCAHGLEIGPCLGWLREYEYEHEYDSRE